MNVQIRKFYEMEEGGSGSIYWYKYYCDANKQLSKLKKQLQEKELIISGIEAGAENWKAEYDNCRVLLNELVGLEELKDKEGNTEDYLFRQPIAWDQAKEFLKDYQHLNW